MAAVRIEIVEEQSNVQTKACCPKERIRQEALPSKDYLYLMDTGDIGKLEDVVKLVDRFYAKVQDDTLIGPIFNEKMQGRWPEHLAKMYTFWQTVLLGEHTYFGSPFPPHAQLPVEKQHFDRWIALFQDTVDAHFSGPKAEEAKWRAGKMAEMFQYKIDHLRKQGKDAIQ